MLFHFLIAIFIGACLGSFGHCVVYRSRHNLKWWGNERSVCLSCSAPISWYDNLPIVSYLILKGKCRKCGSRIPLRYLQSEALGAMAAVWVLMLFS